MVRCPTCSRDAPAGSRVCPACGASLEVASAASTRTSAPTVAPEPRAAPARRLTTDPAGYGRFLPGTLLAGRYRIMGLLGRGGMGEVYRADDLKLGQAVALKFLPASVQTDEARLRRFLNEVKIARQISHANVCRVYDVGEVDGHHFLSMEYVDGEDLASLLPRIGRLPKDKAVQIARQLCAGLAAAHDQGILHRDLKPANVMIDGRGRAKIADFGLAGLAEEIRGVDVGAGTPAYMAPEQRTGKGVSVRSDLYSLGLVLYELFTGQPAFNARTPDEMARLQEESTPTSPSRHVEGFDPAVERIILRCLEREPGKRPSSALAVAAALPGGDPLAAVLAAGETPSPEMVAAAGEEGTLAPARGWLLFGGVAAGLLAIVFLAERALLVNLLPLDRPPEVLVQQAREVARDLGYRDPPADSAWWYEANEYSWDYLGARPAPARYRDLASASYGPLAFWYRQSPRPLVAFPRRVDRSYPPPFYSREVTVGLDLEGRLLYFMAIPDQVDERPGPFPEPDWNPFFTRGGLNSRAFEAVPPTWTPDVAFDRLGAWQGRLGEHPVHVHAATYHGNPVFYQVVGPWDQPKRMSGPYASPAVPLTSLVFGLVLFPLTGAVAILARRNVRLGRGDRKGAFRVAAFVLALELIGETLWTHHVPEVYTEWHWFVHAFGSAAGLGVLSWLAYLALEPYVRRRAPEMLISWTRLLAGDLRDPLVGRAVLTGALFGVVISVIQHAVVAAPYWFDIGGVTPWYPDASLGPLGEAFGRVVLSGAWSVLDSMRLLVSLLVAWIVLRKKVLAVALTWLLGAVFLPLSGENWWLELPAAGICSALDLFCLLRFGLLPLTCVTLIRNLLWASSLTTDLSRWYAARSLVVVLLILALATYGFRTALGRKPLFGAALDQ